MLIVKAYLDFLHIEYDAIEVNPLNKNEIKFSTLKKSSGGDNRRHHN